jgi:hypothetical protein
MLVASCRSFRRSSFGGGGCRGCSFGGGCLALGSRGGISSCSGSIGCRGGGITLDGSTSVSCRYGLFGLAAEGDGGGKEEGEESSSVLEHFLILFLFLGALVCTFIFGFFD